ncbi:transposase family protein [Streptomyces sp. NPDC126510]|uniref:transposase family protein n=1 Tax=Streptomyces sp. NPDC126510 TaxID=3155317 RepID=UPI003329830F
MEFSTRHDLQGCRARCFIIAYAHRPGRGAPALLAAGDARACGLVEALSRVPDPRDPRGVRHRLATLLAVGVCAMTSAGHNSLTAIAEWQDAATKRYLRASAAPTIRSPAASQLPASGPCGTFSARWTPPRSPRPASPA